MTVRPSTPEENAAHRAGVCVDCREKPSERNATVSILWEAT